MRRLKKSRKDNILGQLRETALCETDPLASDDAFRRSPVSGTIACKDFRSGKNEVTERCSEPGCAEAAIVLIGENWLCSPHFIQRSYQQLEKISAGIRATSFHENHTEESARRLEECMRGAADIACSPAPPSNLERARVVDVLLWASELHGRLRRSPRVSARIPVLLRSDVTDRPREEKTETSVLSRHGMQVSCRSEIRQGDTLTCVRLDNGQRVEGRVAWIQRKASGEIEAGVEFSIEGNFWGIAWNENREEARSL